MIKVIYHHPCSDGFCAAYLFWKKYENNAKFISTNYGETFSFDSFMEFDEVYIIDFSLNRSQLLKLANIVEKLTVLDHHKTAQAELEQGPWPKNCHIHFDMNRSGAMMAWDYLHPDVQAPSLVRYVQDRDLWQWKLQNSKEINAIIQLTDFDFMDWEELRYNVKQYFNSLSMSGAIVLRKIAQQVQAAVNNAQEYMLGKHKVWAVNSTVNFSEVAGELGKDGQVGIAWYYCNGRYNYSLRSDSIDVSAIASEFGGGGHTASAGFNSYKFILKDLSWIR